MPKAPRETTDPLGRKFLQILREKGHPDDLNVLAEALNVKVQSTYDYIKHGRVSKDRYALMVEWSGRSLHWWFDVPEPAAQGSPESPEQGATDEGLSRAIPLSAAPAWPFMLISRSRWDKCSEAERGYVQGAMNAALADLEQLRAKPNGSKKV